ncbi:VWA domain-containing protein [bacterium]|nr:VWA domain-containing protein [bacterium]
MDYRNPEALWLFVILPILIVYYFWRLRKTTGSIRYSNIALFKIIGIPKRTHLRHILFLIRLVAISFLILALARPRISSQERKVSTEGVDIMVTLDISESMKIEDFPPNRLVAAKSVVKNFILGRKSDRIGLIVFGSKSFTQCPLTLDYGILLGFLDDVEIGLIEGGTAIGLAIANGANRLRESEAKSKVIVLVTDGENTAGEIAPITAAEIAQTLGIKIYTIGVGTDNPFITQNTIFGKKRVPVSSKIDEEVLQKIAEMTKGKFFRATDKSTFEEIFREIGELEKTVIEVTEFTRYEEHFEELLTWGLLLILLEFLLSNLIFRKIP